MKKFYVWSLRNGGTSMHDGQWVDASELLAAMGVEVCATTVSELSAEVENLKADLGDSERRMHGFEAMWRSAQNERDSALRERNAAQVDAERNAVEYNRVLGENAELRKTLFDAQQMYGAAIEECKATRLQLTAAELQIDKLNKRVASVDLWGTEQLIKVSAFQERVDELLAQVDELTRDVANRDGLIRIQTSTIESITAERNDAVATLRNVQRLLNGDGLLP